MEVIYSVSNPDHDDKTHQVARGEILSNRGERVWHLDFYLVNVERELSFSQELMKLLSGLVFRWCTVCIFLISKENRLN